MIFELGLCSVFWSENGTDTRYFNNDEEQQNYFNNKIQNWFFKNNIELNDLITIDTYVNVLDKNLENVVEYIKNNYCVLRFKDKNNNYIYRYYFAEIAQDNGPMLHLRLRLDDIQTNYFKYKNTIQPCLIKRAHLNRFNKISDTQYSFNFDANSPLHIQEDYNDTSKRLIKREKIKFNFTDNENVNNWINDNINGWLYIFLDKTHDYKSLNLKDWSIQDLLGTNLSFVTNSIEPGYGCIVLPNLKSNNIIIKYEDKEIVYSKNSLNDNFNEFKRMNNDESYFYSKKLFVTSPFFNFSNIEINDNNDLVIDMGKLTPNTNVDFLNDIYFTGINNSFIFIGAFKSGFKSLQAKIELIENNVFNIDFIKNNDLNPKNLLGNFKTISLKSVDGNNFDYNYDIILNNEKEYILKLTENIATESYKYYLRLLPTNLLVNGSDKNYTGLVGNNDNSLSIINSQYAEFLSNNKNFMLQAQNQIHYQNIAGLFGMIGSVATGNFGGAFMQGLGTIANSQKTLNDINLKIDNMKQAPDQINNASGNLLFNLVIDDYGFYLEEYSALDTELEIFNSYCKLFGFKINQINNISNYDNIRKYYNFISANIEEITANISNQEKQNLIDIFDRGVRFWNTDDLVFNSINYEKYFDEV